MHDVITNDRLEPVLQLYDAQMKSRKAEPPRCVLHLRAGRSAAVFVTFPEATVVYHDDFSERAKEVVERCGAQCATPVGGHVRNVRTAGITFDLVIASSEVLVDDILPVIAKGGHLLVAGEAAEDALASASLTIHAAIMSGRGGFVWRTHALHEFRLIDEWPDGKKRFAAKARSLSSGVHELVRE